jgi:magnesium chelatase family protein
MCNKQDIRRYLKKISGPLLDRIDIHVHVPRLEYNEMTNTHPAEFSDQIRQRVEAARNFQHGRLKKYGIFCNAQMAHRHLKITCPMTDEAQAILKQAFSAMSLSGRGYDRIIKVARTIADLGQSEKITGQHIAEAIQFRNHVQGMGS